MNTRRLLWHILIVVSVLLVVTILLILLGVGYLGYRIYQIYVPQQGPAIHSCGVGSLDLQTWVNPSWVTPEAGESVTIRFTIQNSGTDTFTVERSDGPVMDLVVPTEYFDTTGYRGPNPASGEFALPVVRWSDTQAQVLHRLELKPGESRLIELTYIPKVQTGWEQIEGRLWNGHTEYYKCTWFIYVGLGPH